MGVDINGQQIEIGDVCDYASVKQYKPTITRGVVTAITISHVVMGKKRCPLHDTKTRLIIHKKHGNII